VKNLGKLPGRSLVLWLLVPAMVGAQQRVDLLIRGGMLVDGSGAPRKRSDVGVTGDRITFVGDAAASHLTATRTIDAAGLIVAPGLIDPHTHTQADLSSPARRANLAYLMQGVTTVITNNDGGGSIDIGRTLDSWRKGGIGTNAAVYIGEGSVRGAVLGMSSAVPTPAQLDSMRAIVGRGMDQGALGMSTGLYYAPGSYASTEEVIELAKVAAAKGGLYDSHLRDESSYTIGLVGAVNEAIRIGREAHIPIHISHIKALGTDVWGQSDSVIAIIKKARASGVVVTADQYPYDASGTSVGASLLPRWAEAGGRDSLRARASEPATRARLITEMEANLKRRNGAHALLISSTRDTSLLGKRLDEIAQRRHTTPVEAALAIILTGADPGVASFNMTEKDIENFMTPDFVVTGSDGSDGHPRKYGTFPKLFHEYVEQKHVLTLERAVQRSSAETADILGLKDRGRIVTGTFADIVVFDESTFADRSTYEQPTLPATGVRYLLVNGTVTVDGGQFANAFAGRVLTRR
jgi:N-acyl-D-amino-acid deacylase